MPPLRFPCFVALSVFLVPHLFAWTEYLSMQSWKDWAFGEGKASLESTEPGGASQNLPYPSSSKVLAAQPGQGVRSVAGKEKGISAPSGEKRRGAFVQGETEPDNKTILPPKKKERRGKESTGKLGVHLEANEPALSPLLLEGALESIFFSDARGLSRLVFSRFFSSFFDREFFFASFLFSIQQKSDPAESSFLARKAAVVWGGEDGGPSTSFGFLFGIQKTFATLSQRKLSANSFCTGIFGSFFEQSQLRLVYSLIGCAALSKESQRFSLAEAKPGFLTATASFGAISDFSAAGLPWLDIFARGDFFFGRGFSLLGPRQRASRTLYSGEFGLHLEKSFSKGEGFLTPQLAISYSSCASPSKHIFSTEVGVKAGKRFGASLELSLSGEVGAHYRRGGLALCAAF